MEAVKEQTQFLRRDGIAAVAHGNKDLAAAFPDLQRKDASLGTEFHRIVQQIIHNLRNIILLRHGINRALREIHLHLQFLGEDLLLKGNQHLSGTFGHIKPAHFLHRDAALALQLGNIQHAAHQTAQPLCFIGDDLHIMALALRGDGAVENAVDVAADGGHRGFQLMGHVGHKFLTAVFVFLQGGSHIIKGNGQLLHLPGGAACDTNPGIQLSVTEGTGLFRHFLQGLTLHPGQKGHGHHENDHHADGAGGKDAGNFLHHLLGIRHGSRGQHKSHHDPPYLHRPGGNIPALGIDILQSAGVMDTALGNDLLQILLGDPQTLLADVHGRIRGEDDSALSVADQRINAGDLSGQIQIDQKLGAIHGFVPIIGRHQMAEHLGILIQPLEGGVC